MSLRACAIACTAAAVVGAFPTPSRVIDAHVHITNTSLLSYPWASPPPPGVSFPCVQSTGTPCGGDWTPALYASSTSSLPSSAFVFVEVAATPTQWLDEARWVQSLADAHAASVGGIVSGAPPGFGVPGADVAAVTASLDDLAALPLARGIRGSGLNFSDDRAAPTHAAHCALLAARGLSLDVITPLALPGVGDAIARLARAVPSLTIILDHVGSPPVGGTPSEMAQWEQAIGIVARERNVFVKLGGVLQYFKKSKVFPSAAETTPFIATPLRAFGWERSLYEGNWFFCNWPGAGGLDIARRWLPLYEAALGAPTQAQVDALFGGNAEKAYRVRT